MTRLCEVVFSERRKGKVRQERVCSLGRVEELWDSDAIDRMIAKLAQVAWQHWVRAEALKLGDSLGQGIWVGAPGAAAVA